MKETIEKMRSIVAEFDALERVIESFALSKPIIVGSIAPVKPQIKQKKGQKLCKNCGKPGHMQKTCPDLGEETPKIKTRRPPTCSKCGLVGHRSHLCPGQSTSTNIVRSEPLTEDVYLDCVTSKDHGMKPAEIAEATGHSIREINMALQSFSYENYLNRRG